MEIERVPAALRSALIPACVTERFMSVCMHVCKCIRMLSSCVSTLTCVCVFRQCVHFDKQLSRCSEVSHLCTRIKIHMHVSARCRDLCTLVCVCVHCMFGGPDGLTDDDGGDLVPAGPQFVLGLAGERGVDGVIHLPHHQLVSLHQHRVRHRARRPGEKAEKRESEEGRGGWGRRSKCGYEAGNKRGRIG